MIGFTFWGNIRDMCDNVSARRPQGRYAINSCSSEFNSTDDGK